MNSYNEVRQALEPAVGVPFKELAPTLGISLPKDPRKRKAAGGYLVEALLEIAKNSIPRPDLAALGTEVKTIPLNTLSRPREWTKITRFKLAATKGEPDFLRSTPYAKLRCILFVPVMKVDNSAPDFWYLRPPFLWLPTSEQLTLLESDYVAIQQASVREDWEHLEGRAGRYLTLNTSDTNTAGKKPEEKGRAWWLTKDLTDAICEQNLWPREAIAAREAAVQAAESRS